MSKAPRGIEQSVSYNMKPRGSAHMGGYNPNMEMSAPMMNLVP